MAGAEGRAGPKAADLAFMGKLDPNGREPRIVPGGSAQKENATRQRCERRGWAYYRSADPSTGSVFRGWLLTDAGRLALAAERGGGPPGQGGDGRGGTGEGQDRG